MKKKKTKRQEYDETIIKILTQDKPLDQLCKEYDDFKENQSIIKLRKKDVGRYWNDDLARNIVRIKTSQFLNMPLKPRALIFYEYMLDKYLEKICEWYEYQSGRQSGVSMLKLTMQSVKSRGILEKNFAKLNPDMVHLNKLLLSFLTLTDGFDDVQDMMQRQLEETFERLCKEYDCDQFELLLMLPLIENFLRSRCRIIIVAKSETKLGWIWGGTYDEAKNIGSKEIRKIVLEALSPVTKNEWECKKNVQYAKKYLKPKEQILSIAAKNAEKKQDAKDITQKKGHEMKHPQKVQSSENLDANSVAIPLW